jgi:Cupin-like domain
VKRIQVERKSKVLPADIAREHLRGVGRPVIITDATDNWPARSKWTFEFFKIAYGHDPAVAWLGRGGDTGKLTILSAYIDFLDSPSGELPGLWTHEDIGNDECPLPGGQTSPFYLLGWSGLRQHPELYDDIAPPPYFVQDFVSALSPTLRDVFEATSHKQFSAILIGPEGSLSALHRDWWNTHAYLAQIRGRKRAILFSPEDAGFLYSGEVDPELPDLKRFPLFERATAYECVIEPGDTLFIPANWFHHVRGLEKSITVSHNFFNDSNFTRHITHYLRNLPTLVKSIDKSPDWRRALRINWRASDFTDADVIR